MAGTVVALGEDVDVAWLDVPVVTATGGRGGYASRALAAATDLHRVPNDLDLARALALLADGRTALALVRGARITAGETVAVTAAAGGVGSLVVQLAHAAGGFVVALAGAPRKLELALDLGASVGIDYRHADWAAELDRAIGARSGLDVVFDGVGGPTSATLADRTASGGRYLPHGAASGSWGGVDPDGLAARDITVIPLTALDQGPDDLHPLVEQAFRLAADGVLRPTIGQTFPLAETADAHTAMEARKALGKTLLVVG